MMSAMPYPVSTTMEPPPPDRNRLTTAFRLILAIPHLILVGGVGAGFAFYNNGGRNATKLGGETGMLGGIAFLLAVVSWFTIVFVGEHYTPIRRYTHFYLRWRVRALAYFMLLADRYPPFGDGPYPAALVFVDPDKARDRVSVGLRIILAIPHFIVLFFVLCLWWLTTIISWLAILITGRYPQPLYDFGAGALRWLIRVEAYMLLLIDDYPPFSLS
jgi:Domain of unknown function (DUF4389)